MNFLAHIFLSGDDDQLKLGNFIADSLRKKEWSAYPPRVVEGIKLHHSIDNFTDHHPVVARSKSRLRETQAKYAPVVVDIVYDHFLSANFTQIAGMAVEQYAADTYALFQRHFDMLPRGIQHMLPYMMQHNWLVAYGQKAGLQRVFNGMSRRASFANSMQEAVDDLYAQYAAFEADFNQFFPELQQHVKRFIMNIGAT
jgi:acyl carrier protein phosphodiesterase